MDEFEKWLVSMRKGRFYKCDDTVCAEIIEAYRAFKSKAESPDINGLEVTVCPRCGTPIKRCEGCPPVPVKAKADGGLVEKMNKYIDGITGPRQDGSATRLAIAFNEGAKAAGISMREILRAHEGGSK